MPGSAKTDQEELEVFHAFATAARLSVDSALKATPPQPDIRCELNGILYFFELGEITDQGLARMTASALGTMQITGLRRGYSQEEPLNYILGKKAGGSYETGPSPTDLVL